MVEDIAVISPEESSPLLQMQDVAFGYNQRTLLYDVSVAVRTGGRWWVCWVQMVLVKQRCCAC